ncbi:GNAT family N-acetyltransferase [Ottowia thiooxydans]|uniref:GNAT family N-acetyltransferase n=1 Tax=Ottowia thiooxydans TaxID=219182 RepID=UPI00041ACE08|nr:GNAT family N-acetyltransferase [Ottowia thiooxydans]
MPAIQKTAWITGHKLRLRNAGEDAASFIFNLRQDPQRNRHMSATSPKLEDQRQWLARYAADESQAYFVIEALRDVGQPAASDSSPRSLLGTVRLYDAQDDSFCWGSWMLVPGAPPFAAIESALMVYRYALDLGFRAAHFEVQQGNFAVCRFHENFGAVRVGEEAGQIQYTLNHERMLESLHRYRKFLPSGIVRAPFI